MIIRTYRIDSHLGSMQNVGVLPGGTYDKALSFFKNTEAYRILNSLDIPWKIQARDRALTPSECIFYMTDEQYTLWRIAGGDYWSAKNTENGMTAERFTVEGSIENEVAGALLAASGSSIWQPSFHDGLISFARGDCFQISVYTDGLIRGVSFPDYVNFAMWDGSTNMRKVLCNFPFAGRAGWLPLKYIASP